MIFIFSKRPTGVHLRSYSTQTGVISWGSSRREVQLTTTLRAEPRIIGGATVLLLLYAFMAWTGTTLPFVFTLRK
jgi:hypothetical protein